MYVRRPVWGLTDSSRFFGCALLFAVEHRNTLVLSAAKALIELSSSPAYQPKIWSSVGDRMAALAMLMRHPRIDVAREFTELLWNGLKTFTVPFHLTVILALAPHDSELGAKCKSCLASAINRQREMNGLRKHVASESKASDLIRLPEFMLADLIHILVSVPPAGAAFTPRTD